MDFMEMSNAAIAARRKYQNQWAKDNRERRNEAQKRWRKENPEKVKAANRRYWEKRALKGDGYNESDGNERIPASSVEISPVRKQADSLPEAIR